MRKLSTIFILSLTLFALSHTTSFAQIDTTDHVPGSTVGSDFYNNTYWAIGLHASLLSGAGVSGRVSFPKGFMVQASSFVLTLGDIFHFNVGAEGQYAFTQGDGGRLYGLVGAGFYSSTDEDSTKSGNRIANPFRAGLGIGYEWFTSRNFVISTAAAFHWFPSTGEIYPLPEIGMYYYFR